MISKLNYTNAIDVYETLTRINDKFEDFYITKDKTRIFLKDLKLITKLLNTQNFYALSEKEINGLLLIFQEKGYRTYIHLLANTESSYIKLMKFMVWNYGKIDLYCKVKRNNPLSKLLFKYDFIFLGNRGNENLLLRKKEIIKVESKHE